MLLIPVFTTTVADGLRPRFLQPKLRKWVWGERDLGIMLDSVRKVSEDGKE